MDQRNTTSGPQRNGLPTPADPRPTNGYAITALVSRLVLAPLGIVFGHIALKPIKRTGEAGRGLAIGGLTLGYAITYISVVFVSCSAWYACGYFSTRVRSTQSTTQHRLAVREVKQFEGIAMLHASHANEPRPNLGNGVVFGLLTIVGLIGIGITGCGAADGHDSQSADAGQLHAAPYADTDLAKTTIPYTQFAQLPIGVQIDKTARYFKRALEDGALNQYLVDNKAANGYDMKGGIGTGSINEPPQQQANMLTVKVDIARDLAKTDLDLAEDLVSGIYKTDTPSYNAEVSEIKKISQGNELHPTPTTFTPGASSRVFTTGSFANTVANGVPTQVYVNGEDSTGRVFDNVVQQIKSSLDPSLSELVVVEEIDSKDPLYTENFNNL